MFRVLVPAVVLAIALCGSNPGSDQSPVDASSQPLRVLTYNIHHGQGVDGRVDLDRIAAVIRSTQPDIVALQEVDQHVARSGSVDQPAELARLTAMQVVFGGNLSLQGGRYGNAILTKLPILCDQNLPLPSLDGAEQRGLLIAQLRFGRHPLPVLATHLDHRRDDQDRMAGVKQINQWVAQFRSAPAILAGDINATRDSRVLAQLADHWSVAGDHEQPTIPAFEPKRQIDFVLTHPAGRWQVVETRVIDESVASDHRPLLAVLRLPTPAADPIRVRYNDVRQFANASGSLEIAENPSQWQSRRDGIRSAMQGVMGWLPIETKRTVPVSTVLQEVDCGSYVRRLITYQSQPGCETPAYLCIPKQIDGGQRVPAVLCLHPTDNVVGHDVVVGLGGKEHRQYASELAARGYVTLAPSYPLLAGYQPDLAALGWESGTLKAVWDNLRGIDLLQSLPFVEANKIAAIGHSLGGHNSIYTAVFDERIKAVVTSCGFDSYADYYDGDPQVWLPGAGWTQSRYMPRLANYRDRLHEIPFDFDELLAVLAPRPVFVVAPLHDSNFRSASVDRMTVEARKVYSLHGQPDRLQVLHPDCEHDFPDAMREQAYRFLDQAFEVSR
jgi:endonuclease/exonuclease/phosphatase family metal-dependent hydrolase/dienelactone hydrolase